eukprot:1032280-Pleurochrysis_carterae.AAC.3
MGEEIAASCVAVRFVHAASASNDSFGRVSVTLAGAEAADAARVRQAAFTLMAEADATAVRLAAAAMER